MCDNTANLIKARYVVTSTSSEQALNWQALQPELSITELSAEKADFWSLQKHATKAISLFLKQPRRSLLVLKADDQAEYADLLAELIRQEQPKERSVLGVN